MHPVLPPPSPAAPRPAAHASRGPTPAEARRLHLRLPVLPFCAGAMVRSTEQDGALWHLFDARDVPRFFARQKYTCFYAHAATGPAEHLLVDSLNVLERRLRPHGFVRVHRGELVNLRFVRRLRLGRRDGQVAHLELADGQHACISRRRLLHVRAQLRQLGSSLRLADKLHVRPLPA